jgi:hypothetical protein
MASKHYIKMFFILGLLVLPWSGFCRPLVSPNLSLINASISRPEMYKKNLLFLDKVYHFDRIMLTCLLRGVSRHPEEFCRSAGRTAGRVTAVNEGSACWCR